MTRLSLAQIAGAYCGTHSEGDKVYRALEPFLLKNEKVVLDFTNVELASSSFFNELFCQIAEDFGEAVLASHIAFDSMKPRHHFVLERVRPNVSA